MSNAISSAISIASVALNSPTTATASQPRQQPLQQPAIVSGDTLRLTEAQQVYNLYNQGQAVSQIASSLSLSEKAVNGYLGITQGGI